MKTNEALLCAVRAILANSLATSEFVNLLPALLSHLRLAYKRDPKSFNAEAIADLKHAAKAAEIVREFTELLEEVEDMRTRDDAVQLIARLELVASQLKGYAFADRVAKEVREILEKYSSLPWESDVQRRRVLGRAPHCQKCGSPMTLRESSYGPFWGCAAFPRCFGTSNLTPQQASSLE